MKIYIGSDHAGVDLKSLIKERFGGRFEFEDMGTLTTDSVDYPDFAHKVAENVLADGESQGILICGTGNGMAITANKHADIRAALCWSPDIAALAKQHNNANIIVLPARFISPETAFETLEAFFSAQFEGGRHQRRIDKINI
ncbi:MAG: ribose 5-phosphate isomerase B [Bacteroidales bacterium]|nr:ribose 5-phosphate isomerase B [Bacteroidales bacterium]